MDLLFLSYPAALKVCIFRSCEKEGWTAAESLISHFKVPLFFSSDCPYQIMDELLNSAACYRALQILTQEQSVPLRIALHDLQLGISLKQKHSIVLPPGRGKGYSEAEKVRGVSEKIMASQYPHKMRPFIV